MTEYSKAFFGVAEDEPFDLQAAIDAYEWVMNNPEEAPFVVSKMVFDNTAFYMEANRDKIEPVVESYIQKRLEIAKRGVARQISKSGNSVTMGILEEISKAADGVYTGQERSDNAKKQQRDASGRFRVMNRRIIHNESKRPQNNNRYNLQTGVKGSPSLSGQRLAAYQSDYAQVAAALRDLVEEHPNAEVLAHYSDGSTSGVYSAKDARQETLGGHNNKGLVQVDDYKSGSRRVDRIEAVANGTPTGRTLSMDALTAMTRSPGFAEFATSSGANAGGALSEFERNWNQNPASFEGNNERMWGRLRASSKFANETIGDKLPTQAQYALQVGEWAGKYAPQAEKVIGPTARRSAYRYRGVEKQPNPTIQREINSFRNAAGNGREAHEWLIYGRPDPTNKRGTLTDDRITSNTIKYLQDKLPDASLYELNRKSGTIPPSQGIIIDRSGKVVTEAVGYGEDWYLPFNLKNLSRLKGGEYIRTRAYGGLTTEDIYVGLVSGARAVTVVSHSGVYTMEFDDDFRGARRYNDKAGRMHARYAQLLDAVKSGDVTLAEPSPSRMAEIRNKVAADLGLDPVTDADDKDFKKEMERELTRERRDPQLSKEDRDKVIRDAVNQHLVEGGRYSGIADFLSQLPEDRAEQLRDSPEALAEATGANRAAMAAVREAQAINAENLNPLRLNGRGYAKAMEALKDQFPYYIASADYINPGAGRADAGYIKPRFIRPEQALSGFYDESITGKGKLHADKTNYQNIGVVGQPHDRKVGGNWDYKRRDDEEAPKPKEEPKGTGASTPRAESTPDQAAYKRSLKSDAIVDLVKNVQAQTSYSTSEKAARAGVAGQAITDDVKADPRWSALWMPIDEIQNKLNAEGPDGPTARSIKSAIETTRQRELLDLDPNVLANYDSGGATKTSALPDSVIDLLGGIGNKSYEFKGLELGHPAEHYEQVIDSILERRRDFGAVGLAADTPAAEAVPLAQRYANQLRKEAMSWVAYENQDTPNAARPVMPKARIDSEAKDLARLVQAYNMRDLARPKAEAPKAEASVEEAVEPVDYADQMVEIAKPYQDQIRSMTGLGNVADQVDTLVAQAVAQRRRADAGLPNPEQFNHLIFTGNPGVGKTSVAKIIAPLYYELGLVNSPDPVITTAGQIKGPYSNSVRESTTEFLNEHKGSVIFIDEAHQLANDEYSRQALEAIVPWASENRDTVIIMAGYPEHMGRMLSVDPGLDSRFPQRIGFKDYTPDEMVSIADSVMNRNKYTAPASVRNAIHNTVRQLATKEGHANGREVDNFITELTRAQNNRLLNAESPSVTQLSTFTMTDVNAARRKAGL